MAISQNFDGLFQIDLGGSPGLIVTKVALATELADPTRFRKVLNKALWELRTVVGDGLFTARTEEPNWAVAHRVLMPAFGQRAMRGYFPMMLEVADSLVAKWASAPGADIQVADDMTRLTMDTISLAGFGRRFGSFARPDLHPFLTAMGRALRETMDRLTQIDAVRALHRRRARIFAADVATMNALVDEVIQERRAAPNQSGDLLNLMLTTSDPDTGLQLDDINIRFQVLTFLLAGHETTSGLLTFALYLLMAHPAVLAQAYAEIDRILPGDTRPQYAHMARLDVIDRVLKEALRLWPTAPAYSVGSYEDTVLAGYRIPKDQRITVLLPALHRDPAVWADPEVFDIDRFLPAAEAALPPHAYKPFGNGGARLHRPAIRLDRGKAGALRHPTAFRVEQPEGLPADDQGDTQYQTRRLHPPRPAPPRA